ncbi:hypothetical protein C7G41_22755 [Bradyrhizobium sp. MOS002]|nr:hypothetical protein C7G41_22755 [Bradyrhizobium sp. MOS002]
MTWAIVDRVFKARVGLGGAAKAVLLSLANHCDKLGGSCFPGQDVIESETELSLDTIQRALAALELDGWIERWKRRVRGQWPSWEYQINVEKLIDRAAPYGSVDQAAPCGSVDTDRAAPCGLTEPHRAAPPGRTMRLKPILEPINEPSRARSTDDRPAPRQRADALGAGLNGQEQGSLSEGSQERRKPTASTTPARQPACSTEFRSEHACASGSVSRRICCGSMRSSKSRCATVCSSFRLRLATSPRVSRVGSQPIWRI